ncbi:MAG TPA: FG-GAP-like repeat-containing protein, partial [Thermoanaerobaculia bacterium]|nr:FG-GAP-like repeat-containing protein [Thermoanaerobaculia bacterium]
GDTSGDITITLGPALHTLGGLVGILPSGSNAMVLADFNLDGRLDVAVIAAGYTSHDLLVFLGTGTGTLGAPSTLDSGYGSSSLATGDFNGDGKPDLAVANTGALGGNMLRVFLGDGSGGFGAPSSFPSGTGAESLAVGDFNGDGRADVVAASTNLSGAWLLLGDGTGWFAAPTKTELTIPTGVILAGDVNRDGKLDLVALEGSLTGNRVAVLLGNGDGSFVESVSSLSGIGTRRSGVLADLDRNGTLDVAYSNGSEVFVLLGTGDGTFGPPSVRSASGASSIQAVDVNGDGNLDLILTTDVLEVLKGDGLGGFGPSTRLGGPRIDGLTSLATGDFDRNGKPDIAVASRTLSFVLNTNCSPRHLTPSPQLSPCDSPGVPFAAQPAFRLLDDGGNLVTCAAGSVSASLLPGAGTSGATLNGTKTVPVSAGIATFTGLSVDLPGRGYRLAFAYPGSNGTWSRTFTQGLTASIGGPSALCEAAVATFDGGPGYDTYAWRLDGMLVSHARRFTSSSLTAGSHVLHLDVSEDDCSAGTSATLAVKSSPPAPAASSNTPVCVGATLQLTSSAADESSYAWTGPNGFTSHLRNPSIPAATESAAGTYRVVVTAPNGCPSAAAMVVVAVDADSATPIVSAPADAAVVQTVCQ